MIGATLCCLTGRESCEHISTGWESLEGLAWAPSGKEIWFSAAESGEQWCIHAVSLSGKERTVYCGTAPTRILDIASSGRALVSTEEARGTMALVRAWVQSGTRLELALLQLGSAALQGRKRSVCSPIYRNSRATTTRYMCGRAMALQRFASVEADMLRTSVPTESGRWYVLPDDPAKRAPDCTRGAGAGSRVALGRDAAAMGGVVSRRRTYSDGC